MTLFTVGPVSMFPGTLALGAQPLPYFRTAEFSAIMLDCERMMLETLHAPEGSRVVTLTASGTGAMECAVMHLLTPEDKVLVVDGGGFGHRFVEMCAIHGRNHTALKLPFGETLTAEKLAPYKGQGYTALLVNIDETSIGQLYDIGILKDFCKAEGCRFIVDAISSYLADPLDMAGSGVDAIIISSQKGLALPPGLSFLVLTPELVEEQLAQETQPCMYLGLKSALVNMRRGQTPFTCGVGMVLQLQQRLAGILEVGGVESEISRCRRLAQHFRSHLPECFSLPEFPFSNAVTPVLMNGCSAKHLFEELKNRHNIFVTPSGGELADKMLRIGHLGNLCEADYDELCRLIPQYV